MDTHIELNQATLIKCVIGGLLMGLANLVPGISGGTMLLAAGVYTAFIAALAGLSTFKITKTNIVVIALIGCSAVVAILFFAGPVKTLVIEHRWLMYSWFVGLTLGGAPLIWRLAEYKTPAFYAGAVVGIAMMVAMGMDIVGNNGDQNIVMLLIAGVSSSSAMILPGVSGGYLLLLLGQYENFLGAIDLLKTSLTHVDGFQVAMAIEAGQVLVPIGIGIVLGLVVVSNLLKWVLNRYEQGTLGWLLGLLLGAVFGLWPFQQPVAPQVGDVIRGKVLSADMLSQVPTDKWPLEIFAPSASQAVIAIGLVLTGLLITLGVDWLGRKLEKPAARQS